MRRGSVRIREGLSRRRLGGVGRQQAVGNYLRSLIVARAEAESRRTVSVSREASQGNSSVRGTILPHVS